MESAWVYDFVLAFLKSPVFTAPVNSFIDKECIVFDNEEENKLIYTEIHSKFKKLIDGLFERNLSDIGISTEQFVAVLARGNSQLDEKIVDNILCADDFLHFKKNMLKRNQQLEREALKAISARPTAPLVKERVDKDLEAAIALSLQMEKAESMRIKSEEDELKEAIFLSLRESSLRTQNTSTINSSEIVTSEPTDNIVKTEETENQVTVNENDTVESNSNQVPIESFEVINEIDLKHDATDSNSNNLTVNHKTKDTSDDCTIPGEAKTVTSQIPMKPVSSLPPITKNFNKQIAINNKVSEVISNIIVAPKSTKLSSHTHSTASVSVSELERRKKVMNEQKILLTSQATLERESNALVEQEKFDAKKLEFIALRKNVEKSQEHVEKAPVSVSKSDLSIREALAAKFKKDILGKEKSKPSDSDTSIPVVEIPIITETKIVEENLNPGNNEEERKQKLSALHKAHAVRPVLDASSTDFD